VLPRENVDMSTKSAISIEEYLRTSFEDLDREYVDGEIVERSLPDEFHSETQWRLSGLIWDLSKTRPFHGRPDLRSRVSPTRIRIPDVAIYAGAKPNALVPSEPPLVAIETLSPDDRHSEVMQKFEEYEAWGVRHVWLVDPRRRKLQVYGSGTLSEVAVLEIEEYHVRITPADIFG
jgi:Uma2 family endonuclease